MATRTMIRYTHELIGHLGHEHHCKSTQEVLDSSAGRQFVLFSADFLLRNGPFGPLYIKLGGSKVKRWCCLFTCLNTRAIHLQMVHSMNLMIV